MPEDRLVIRADANHSMGTGHVMRMIALGQAWADRGGAVRFLGRIESEPLRVRIAAEGFELVDLDSAHPAPADLAALLEHSAVGGWVALDGYHFDTAYMRAARSSGRKTLVLDDINDRGEYAADVLLNQNLRAEHFSYRVNPEARQLLGLRYALLRREFRAVRAAWSGPHQPLRLLVTMGGSDPVNFTATVLRALALPSGHDFHVRVVVGPANANRDELARLTGALPMPVDLATAGQDMPGHMAWADLAVTAAGSTCWELAHMGVPMLAFELAENQAGVLVGLASTGAAVSGGRAAETTPADVAALLAALNPQRLVELSARARAVVDGQGAFRVVEALRPTQLRLRPASQQDSLFLWRLANDAVVRAVSFTHEPISVETHTAWLAAKLANPACQLLVAMDQGGNAVGQVRLEEEDGGWVVSVSLAEPYRGGGIGSGMIRQACSAWAGAHPGQRILAYVQKGNSASEKAFVKAGFIQTGSLVIKDCQATCFTFLPQDRQ